MKRLLICLLSLLPLLLLPLDSSADKNKGPSDRAYDKANDNASFKRDNNDKHKKKNKYYDDDDDHRKDKKKNKNKDKKKDKDKDKDKDKKKDRPDQGK